MGTDIHGFIEFRLDGGLEYWHTAVDIGSVAERYYKLFGYLFGIRELIDKYLPVAAGRGLPSHVGEIETIVCVWWSGLAVNAALSIPQKNRALTLVSSP